MFMMLIVIATGNGSVADVEELHRTRKFPTRLAGRCLQVGRSSLYISVSVFLFVVR